MEGILSEGLLFNYMTANPKNMPLAKNIYKGREIRLILT